MANDNKKVEQPPISKKKVNKLTSGIQSLMDNIYRKTYYSPTSVDANPDALSKSINTSIDNIVNTNKAMIGMPNVSKLYTRISDLKTSTDIIKNKDISSLFEDNSAIDNMESMFTSNTYIKEMDDEIDAICKYMPKLQEALDTKRDNVLCAEHFSKDFLTMTCDAEEEKLFSNRASTIKKEYNLLDLANEIYDHASKYGEDFIYIVPYKKALAKLLYNKDNTQLVNVKMEAAGIKFEDSTNNKLLYSDKLTFLKESATDDKKEPIYIQENLLNDKEKFALQVEISESNIIDSIILNKKYAIDKLKKINEASLFNEASGAKYDTYISADADTEFKKGIENDTNIVGNLSFEDDKKKKEDDKDTIANDGLIMNQNKYKLETPGCIVKRIDHKMVAPLYIDDICVGYYYLEFFKTNDTMDTQYGLTNMMQDPMVSSNANKTGTMWHNVEGDKQDQIMKYLSGKLSKFIDKKFINSNADLRQEIYTILKANDIFNSPNIDRLKITFVPPDEMIHVFFKQDPITHRGISDLENSLLPAKIYCSLYLTNTLQSLTRGYDKRVYYVKQQVESNIAKTLLNTLTQIKQNDMNIRHFRSINTVLNITGRFNDYIIPENASGESPIRMETIQGNPPQTDENLMNSLEEMAINLTDVPIELIQARQSMQFATEYSMSSIKFLRKVYKRQAQTEKFLNILCTKIYNSEYESQIEVKVTLPPPIFLNITNSTQVMENAKSYVASIVEMDLGQNPDPNVQMIYNRELLRDAVGTYIDIEKNKKILDKAKAEASEIPSDDNGAQGQNMMM